MIKFSKSAAFAVVVSVCVMALSPFLTQASGTHGKIMVEDAWARASKGKVAGAFMMIKSHADADDVLLSVASDVAKRVEIHTTKNVDGVMKMMQMVEGVPIAHNGEIMLKPGGYHVMLMGLNQHLNEGDTFSIRLTFKNAGVIDTQVTVKQAGAMGAMKHDHKMSDDKKTHKHSD